MPTEITRPALSVEYLSATVTSNIALGSQVVRMAVIAADTSPVQGDFSAVSWVDSASTTNTARKSAAAYAAGTYDIYVQVVSSPEIPVLYAGRMTTT